MPSDNKSWRRSAASSRDSSSHPSSRRRCPMSGRNRRVVIDRPTANATLPVASVPLGLRTASKIRDDHLDRLAMGYVRPSSPPQGIENRDSAEREYALG